MMIAHDGERDNIMAIVIVPGFIVIDPIGFHILSHSTRLKVAAKDAIAQRLYVL